MSSRKPSTTGDRALVACAAWLLTGFIGATTVAAGLVRLFDGGAKSGTAMMLAFGGTALASAAWIHARACLDRAKSGKTIVAGASAESTGAK
jgi:hypothetical protein